MDLQAYLVERSRVVDKALDAYLPRATARPATIHKAMRYSLFAGGKRMRPILTLAAAEACGVASEAHQRWPLVLSAACAVECIHTYSLIHDDLPCMDDDDLRRGKPTNHKVFGEGIAVLAGDALLTVAFEILASQPAAKRYPCAALIKELSEAAGSKWLIAGQTLDLEGEGKSISKNDLRFIHEAKTGALLTSSLRLGAMGANAKPEQLEAVTEFGKALGLAFQIIDDILDVTQPTEKLGKTAGKDVKATKATYPALFGMEHSRAEAKRLTKKALSALHPLGKRALRLEQIADYLLTRDY